VANKSKNTFTYGRKIALFGLTALVLGFVYTATISKTSQAQDDTFSAAQKEALGAFIEDYVVAHPELIIEALESYQNKQKTAEQEAFAGKFASSKDAILNSAAPWAGNEKGDVTVVEFFDYNCGYCRKALKDIVQLLDDDKNVKVIFMDMPILSPTSQEAARWSLAADKQGKYYEYHVALMNDSGSKNARKFASIAEKLGMDVEKLKKDAESKEVRTMIEANLALARDLGIRGTPGFIIGDTLSPGYIGYSAMKDIVEQTRQGGQ